mmetsp:Transcript_28478/g.69454  ORF Transcript_28478/g.69454 Transcript_28478/m.69454 type:complete len:652 (-) Transcript_28478:213-2168(-)|eukprot:CAMPEP_0114505758 /NCGR_PEP_ID=MMETSP0109-20121206/11032_1 /TAXON_ID=29199 /ORGANISM="Chlorarachnion reptans, Strain CCCM449" /LENGTH=651 /DNA_ID=CAMNT_0001684235 /DNA_START=146 /DNA_END=2101 /DNA_ORIENTATION=+
MSGSASPSPAALQATSKAISPRPPLLPMAAIQLAILLQFIPPAAARFYYPNFLDVTALKLRGSAQKHGKCLMLTDHVPNEVGGVWYKRSVSVSEGFFTAFNIRITPPPIANSGKRNQKIGGEGMAFVLHKSPYQYRALGLKGSGLGYTGLHGAIAIEFDTHMDANNEDPNGNHVSLHLPRETPERKEPISNAFEIDLSLARTDVPSLTSGSLFTVQVNYDGETIKIFLNDLVNPILKRKLDLSGEYWLGFTASTGQDEMTISRHRVCDWYFETAAKQSQCDHGFVGSACALDAGPAVSECLGQKSCHSCLQHVRDCRWCSSQQRCVAGAISTDTVSDLKKDFCEDPLSLISDERECRFSGHDFNSMWNSFLAILLALMFFASFGKNIVIQSSVGRRNSQTCFQNSANMHHLFSLLESTCAGAIFAVLISYSVNYSLFLFTTYRMYSMGIGVLLLGIGSLILWQATTQYFEGENNGGALDTDETSTSSHCILLCAVAVFLISCGLVCLMLEGDFASHMSSAARIVVYASVAISLCFSIVFVLVDLVTRAANLCRHRKARPLAEHPTYSWLLAVSACISGLYFGYVFGMLDLENMNKGRIELALQQQNYYCYPLGCLLGGITAFINRFMALSVHHQKNSGPYWTKGSALEDGL